MKRAAYAIAALASLVAAPAVAVTPDIAGHPITLAQVDVYIGDRDRDRERFREHRYREHREGCKTVIIKERHHGELVVRRIRRCGED